MKSDGITPNKADQEASLKAFNDLILWVVDKFVGYITVKNAALISGYSIDGANNRLDKLADHKLLKKHSPQKKAGRPFNLYGITKLGRQVAREADNDEGLTGWSISHFNKLIMQHEMMIQRVAANAKKLGNTATTATTIGGRKKHNNQKVGGKMPDLFINGIPIEIELNIKKSDRYPPLLEIYDVNQITSLWMGPPSVARALNKIIDNVKPRNPHQVYTLEDNGEFSETDRSLERRAEYQARATLLAEEEQAAIKQAQQEQADLAEAEKLERQAYEAEIEQKNRAQIENEKRIEERQHKQATRRTIAKIAMSFTVLAMITGLWFSKPFIDEYSSLRDDVCEDEIKRVVIYVYKVHKLREYDIRTKRFETIETMSIQEANRITFKTFDGDSYCEMATRTAQIDYFKRIISILEKQRNETRLGDRENRPKPTNTVIDWITFKN